MEEEKISALKLVFKDRAEKANDVHLHKAFIPGVESGSDILVCFITCLFEFLAIRSITGWRYTGLCI